jgi:hypothetical protein
MSIIPALLIVCFLVTPAIALLYFLAERPEKEMY